jgi:glutamate synthase domain-containing protein 2/glutamate synthase domain-containing protein 1/glutamate synthase domain-containing protein 3
MTYRRLPPPQGLYDPRLEKDSCGVGFIADLKGRVSHQIIEKAIEILVNLRHRGACGCDANTGDGAGILFQLPHEFFRKEAGRLGVSLPAPGEYGAGMIFLPAEEKQRRHCERLVRSFIADEGQRLLAWRDVPTDDAAIGWLARESKPAIRQVIVGSRTGDPAAFERKLYVIRKRLEIAVRKSGLERAEQFYIPSFSARTIVYKGLMVAHQLSSFYPDLADRDMASGLALVHSRYSTNTFPTWDLAHPFRFLCHNGEINTLRGNVNWMQAREAHLQSPLFGKDVKSIVPVITPGASDSAQIDNVLELLVLGGRSLPHAIMMLIPEAWGDQLPMDPEKRGFYEYHASLMEPWDGPASIAFTDGKCIGAVLDRNGLRPSRYIVTKGGLVVMASEVGVLDIPPGEIETKGRLQPGKMFLVDTDEGRIVGDVEVKQRLSTQKPYRQWVESEKVKLADLPEAPVPPAAPLEPRDLLCLQQAFGYTLEDLRMLMAPMALKGEEAVGSMGTDTPLAVLSDRQQPLFNYFKQLFAQVTNPPIDPIREELVMSLVSRLGAEGNLFDESPEQAHQLELEQPILSNAELEKIRQVSARGFRASTLPALFEARGGERALETALDELCRRAADRARAGDAFLIVSDRGVDRDLAPIPILLALSAVHHHLIREGLRTRVGLVVETGEAREVVHYALLIGYGAGAINPYLAFETLKGMAGEGLLPGVEAKDAVKQYVKAIKKGLLKIFSKMGISTLQSYRGAQIFEAVGLDRKVVDKYFTWTPSRVEGAGLPAIQEEARMRHERAYPRIEVGPPELDAGGQYQWRVRGEHHMWNPISVSKLQHAVRQESYATYREFSAIANDQSRKLATLRGLLTFKKGSPIPIDEVEPAKNIVTRFCTGAMSFGSISKEAHENLAIAMNRIGGKSNTGEGGEDPARFIPLPNGDSRSSAIKQVASARFGVTSEYLVNARELQIKMAQGAKPGEGGQLPGHKVDEVIARTRYSTPGVTLISPPPHHDIYSIEDLAQLIFDLKNANPRARVSVKLVAEVGVGTVAAGVSKAKADGVLISGHDGGTGASPLTSIKHAGIPWEIGLAETQQVLVLNDLRGRIRVQTDGQLKTGRDVAIATLLGAEEYGFATAPLVASGCLLMRKCHLNTCPVGIATQDPRLRRKFAGKPEHVVNFFFYVAEELREIMAELGFRKVDDMVGRVDFLETRGAIDHWKAKGIDLSTILYKPEVPPAIATRNVQAQDHGLEGVLDHHLVALAKPAIEHRAPVDCSLQIQNSNRTTGAILGSEVTRRHGGAGLPDDTITFRFKGSAGQSFGAFLPRGITLVLEGDSNDYIGKGLSGGKVIVFPPKESTFVREENIIIGNTVLYGATGGEAYFSGVAGERFAVRMSGAYTVVEGVGDHGCEYMTKGVAVVLGPTGRNFAAGMSGGVAFVLDEDGDFDQRANLGMVELEDVVHEADIQVLRELVEKHVHYTGSPKAKRILDAWDAYLPRFVKVMPNEYRLALERLKEKAVSEQAAKDELSLAAGGKVA